MDTGADNSIEKLTITFDDALGDVGKGGFTIFLTWKKYTEHPVK